MNDLIQKYIERGFGSMNKNDFEVAIFNELLQSGWKEKSNRTISIELKIPETKVKRLRYESELKYGKNTDDEFKTRLEEVLEKAHFNTDGKKLVFVMENLMLRNYLDGKLKDMGLFSDRSFNSEVVSVNAKDFITLLKELDFDKDIIRKSKNASLKNSLSEIVRAFKDISTIVSPFL